MDIGMETMETMTIMIGNIDHIRVLKFISLKTNGLNA